MAFYYLPLLPTTRPKLQSLDNNNYGRTEQILEYIRHARCLDVTYYHDRKIILELFQKVTVFDTPYHIAQTDLPIPPIPLLPPGDVRFDESGNWLHLNDPNYNLNLLQVNQAVQTQSPTDFTAALDRLNTTVLESSHNRTSFELDNAMVWILWVPIIPPVVPLNEFTTNMAYTGTNQALEDLHIYEGRTVVVYNVLFPIAQALITLPQSTQPAFATTFVNVLQAASAYVRINRRFPLDDLCTIPDLHSYMFFVESLRSSSVTPTQMQNFCQTLTDSRTNRPDFEHDLQIVWTEATLPL